jgi:DNA polymerase-1
MEISDLGEEEGLEDIKKPTKIALIDADTIVYSVASTNEYADDLLSQDMYTKEEWDEITSDPSYDPNENCLWKINLDEALDKCKARIQEIQEITFTKDVVLFFTQGKNFRHEVCPMYKANRKHTRYPQGLKELKELLLQTYNGEICEGIEADDAVVYLKRTHPDKYVLCSPDKDVYRSVAGKHFNYYQSTQHKIAMKWVETSKEDAEEFPYIQTLTGDSTDNIRGCPGIGAKRAILILKGCSTPLERWEAVVKAFESKGLTAKDAIRDMRLVNMHQVERDKDGKWIWNPWIQPLI